MSISQAISQTWGYLFGAVISIVVVQALNPDIYRAMWTIAVHAVIYSIIVLLFRRYA